MSKKIKKDFLAEIIQQELTSCLIEQEIEKFVDFTKVPDFYRVPKYSDEEEKPQSKEEPEEKDEFLKAAEQELDDFLAGKPPPDDEVSEPQQASQKEKPQVPDPQFIITDMDDAIIKDKSKMAQMLLLARKTGLSEEQTILIMKALSSNALKPQYSLFYENKIPISSLKQHPRTTPQSLGINDINQFRASTQYKNILKKVETFLVRIAKNKKDPNSQIAAGIEKKQLEFLLLMLFAKKKIAVPVPAGPAAIKSQETSKAVQQRVNENK